MIEGALVGLAIGISIVFAVFALRDFSLKKLVKRLTWWCSRNDGHQYEQVGFGTPWGVLPSHRECEHCGKRIGLNEE